MAHPKQATGSAVRTRHPGTAQKARCPLGHQHITTHPASGDRQRRPAALENNKHPPPGTRGQGRPESL
eukprot:7833740-Alexandrium_andersonii.AAC.1